MCEIGIKNKMLSFILLIIVSHLLSFETHATPLSAPEDKFICPGVHGAPLVVTKSYLDNKLPKEPIWKEICRPELVWDSKDRWLCRFNRYELLVDFPLKEVGRFDDRRFNPGFDLKTIDCKKLQFCEFQTTLLFGLICTNKEDDWYKTARELNQIAMPFDQPCNSPGHRTIYISEALELGSVRESDVLQGSSPLLMILHSMISEKDLKEYVDPGLLSSLIHRSYISKNQDIAQKGVYCLENERVSHIKKIEQIKSARFMTNSEAHPIALNRPSAPNTNPAVKICKTDDDCIQGVFGNTCLTKGQMVSLESEQLKPSFRCRCASGPVMHGCVPEIIEKGSLLNNSINE